ncbi:Flp family type IVb pilin [Massilia dura]|uniref:Flp family type IVb pilin n=1 Tax=Pseudoduganella dura TaxID=321982 RepID=A0A6I3XL11_9BURK|nr:Flp family type IVb pilin [Pseudoduganella dura]MUI13258.1 Flp family type IVb pilin [Pseudoduganella dura]GGX90573.1 pilus subunit protein [Pseudoduganella dura]
MKAFIVAAQNFARDEEGVTAIEYGLVAAVIAGVVVAAFKTLGAGLNSAFTAIAGKITTVLNT